MPRQPVFKCERLVNAAVGIPLYQHVANKTPGPDLKPLELTEDAPANLEWLHNNSAAHGGEWVALLRDD